MRYHAALSAALSVMAIVEANPSADQNLSIRSALPEGYNVEPMTWTGIIERGGPELSFSGTADEITQQIQAVKKDFTWENLRRDLGVSSVPPQKRDGKNGIICGVGGEDVASHGALTSNMKDTMNKIAGMTGTCAVAAGPRVCSVIACTRNAAAWLCNDNAGPIAPPCNSLASYVEDIISACGLTYYHGHQFTRGQEFDTGNFNVVVGWDSHC